MSSFASPAYHVIVARLARIILETNLTVVQLTQTPLPSAVVRGHHASERRAVLGAVQGSSLRSAHARVRAWPSGLDGACAQLAGLQLRDGHSLRLESKPGDASVRKSLVDAFYRIGGQDVRDGSAARA
jgi:hypothetical protein